VGKKEKNKKSLSLLASAHHVNQSMEGGGVKDLESLEKSLITVVHEVEQQAGEITQPLCVGLPPQSYQSMMVELEMDIKGPVVTSKHIDGLLSHAHIASLLPKNRELIHLFPVGFSVDQLEGVRDPRGLVGETLKGHYHFITSPSATLEAIRAAFYHCHLSVKSFWAMPYCAQFLAPSFIKPQKDHVCLIDIGATSTSLSYYYHGVLAFTHTVSLGSDHITRDIAQGFNLSILEAERLKTLEGVILPLTHRFESEETKFFPHQRTEDPAISKAMLSRIMRARMEEIMEHAWKPLHKRKIHLNSSLAVLVAGGGSHVSGFKELVEQLLDYPVMLWGECMQPSYQNDSHYLALRPSTQAFLHAVAVADQGLHTRLKAKEAKNIFQKTCFWLKENF
jgi:cell division protein FtsA